MGTGTARARSGAVEAAGAGITVFGARTCGDAGERVGLCGDEPARNALSLRVTEDRVLIQADREVHAPTQTETGLFLASSLAAAVEGEDAAESWFVGTIVQLGPLVAARDCRRTLAGWLLELEEDGHDISHAEIMRLRQRVEVMPRDMPDPLRVGDRVTFSWASGQQIAVDGDKFIILRASDVLAVLEETE